MSVGVRRTHGDGQSQRLKVEEEKSESDEDEKENQELIQDLVKRYNHHWSAPQHNE